MAKILKASEMLKGSGIQLEVDGGVGLGNILELSDLGVGICVAGSGVFKTGDPNANGLNLKKACQRF
jgi:ribulose-phosphate 3-epimerase